MNNNDGRILEDSIFKVGKVVSVDGRIVRIKVDKTKNSSHLLYKGELLKNISVGGYIKVIKGFTKIIAKVDGEFTSEDPLFSKKEYGSEKEKINRILAVSLLGFFKGEVFERGIKELPLVGNECYLLPNEEFNEVHNFIRGDDEPIDIGRLALEKGQGISVGVNSLFASHIGIFGNTGSGKSYTLAKIYHELFSHYKAQKNFIKNANFFLIDFNGEYSGDGAHDDILTEKKYKNIYKLSTRTPEGGDKFPVPKSALLDPAFWSIFLDATEKTQAPFLDRALSGNLAKEIFDNTGDEEETAKRLRQVILRFMDQIIEKQDRNLGIKIFSELLFDLEPSVSTQDELDEIKRFVDSTLNFNSSTEGYYVAGVSFPKRYDEYEKANINQHFLEPLRTRFEQVKFHEDEVHLVRLKIIIKYYDEIAKGYPNRDFLSPLIKRLDSRIKDLVKVIKVEAPAASRAKNLTIISLRDVNIHIRKILPLLLCKNLYDDKKKQNDPSTYLNIIIDEAHNILSSISERESEQWKDYRLETFEEIIKEGRKFGVFLTIASQRPADISPTILSQLHNYFLHRLINNNDIHAVEKTISYLDKISFEYLPILPTGTCILAGLLAQVPVVVDIGRIPDQYEPQNKTMTLIENWKD